jgi:transposase
MFLPSANPAALRACTKAGGKNSIWAFSPMPNNNTPTLPVRCCADDLCEQTVSDNAKPTMKSRRRIGHSLKLSQPIHCRDNLPAHNVAGIEEAINAVGATLRYLPKYSLDLNPIELPYSKFKAYQRKLAARTVPSLRAIRPFLHILKPRECAHYYKHAGYAAI